MFKNLQTRWKVSAFQAVLILCTFAIGGSACGFFGRQIMHATGMDKHVGWYVTYIVLVTLLWPICVIVISIPLGQFRFFKGYLSRMFARLTKSKSGQGQQL